MIFIVINLLLSPYINPTLLILADIAIWTLVNIILTRAIAYRESKSGKKLFD